MSNTIQIKRFNETGETPDDRGTVLAYGELAVNTADNTLWVGNNIGVNQLLSAHTRIGPDEPVMPVDKLIGTFWFDTTLPESIKVWNGTAFVTFVGGAGGAENIGDLNDVSLTSQLNGDILKYNGTNWVNVPFVDTVGGQVDSVVAGTNVTVDNTDPANPIVSATGGGGGGSSDVEFLDDLTDVQIGVGYAGFTEWVSSTPYIVEDYQYVVAGDYMAYTNAAAESMQKYNAGDVITFTWAGGATTVVTVNNGSAFNDANTEFLRFTAGGSWPTDPAILASPLVLTSTPERFPGAADGNVLTYNGTTWVAEEPTGGGGGSVEVLNDLTDVSLTGFSESTRVRSGSLPSAPGEYRCGANFIQTHISHREGWEKYQVGDELTFVYEDVGNGVIIKGPFTVTTAYAIDTGGSPWGVLYASDAPNGDDLNDGAQQGMTVFSNPERAVPKTGEVLTYDGTNWVSQELAEFTDRAVLADLDDVDFGFSVNVGIDDNVIGSVYATPGAYRITAGSTVFIYRKEIHDQMSSLQLGDIFYFRWPSVDEVAGPFQITVAPAVNDASTYYLNWGAVGGGPPDPISNLPLGPSMYMTFGTEVGHTLVFDGTNWVSEAPEGVEVLDDLSDVALTASITVEMGIDGNIESGPGFWEFGGAGNTLTYNNSISAEMSQFSIDDAVYITWPSEGLSYGPFIITEGPAFNTANTEYFRVNQTINTIPIPAGNPPMVVEKSSINAGDVLTYDGSNWVEGKGLAAIKEATAAATDFADFQARIAAL